MTDVEKILIRAEEKLEYIIKTEGDLGGKRRESWYLEQLIEEEAQAFAFENFCKTDARKKLNSRQNSAA